MKVPRRHDYLLGVPAGPVEANHFAHTTELLGASRTLLAEAARHQVVDAHTLIEESGVYAIADGSYHTRDLVAGDEG